MSVALIYGVNGIRLNASGVTDLVESSVHRPLARYPLLVIGPRVYVLCSVTYVINVIIWVPVGT